ncbi:golgin subfamily B member 1-like [Senna tora]|uniref:Golgin subfamily B member 1-like n=1 Tax=Senna tora TaxID=362788 RepID=A0A835CHF2_9FABA|nr:golgin subfamily B member 1-like [Senna tora]
MFRKWPCVVFRLNTKENHTNFQNWREKTKFSLECHPNFVAFSGSSFTPSLHFHRYQHSGPTSCLLKPSRRRRLLIMVLRLCRLPLSYQTIMSSLEGILIEKLELESVTKEVKSELMQREKELKELFIKCVGLDDVSKLIADIEGELNVEDTNNKMNKEPLLHLTSLVSSFIHKTREVDMQSHITKGAYGSKVMWN